MNRFKTSVLKLILLFGCLILQSQEKLLNKEEFIRVYDLNGKKISKGNIIELNDSILKLKLGSKKESISYQHIGLIKTKRSGGHNVFMGTLIGIGIGTIVGATLGEPDDPDSLFGFSRGEYAAIGALAGAEAGLLIGGISALVKNPNTYVIEGEQNKWRIFKEYYYSKLP